MKRFNLMKDPLQDILQNWTTHFYPAYKSLKKEYDRIGNGTNWATEDFTTLDLSLRSCINSLRYLGEGVNHVLSLQPKKKSRVKALLELMESLKGFPGVFSSGEDILNGPFTDSELMNLSSEIGEKIRPFLKKEIRTIVDLLSIKQDISPLKLN